ncbi:hypothetical protein M422DRAFT_235374 [Sphaerobolus stellatus SS14]|uniref:Uncharacterized protein n=1 Tax=Sphaerobolus stellatus (strain SS14) TaxID=990650 RepID=A0A0C9UVH1_SPHS4|nr:hypothetical protein M422DRAFT_235374 [Sphaerobolus stellatus SS14]
MYVPFGRSTVERRTSTTSGNGGIRSESAKPSIRSEGSEAGEEAGEETGEEGEEGSSGGSTVGSSEEGSEEGSEPSSSGSSNTLVPIRSGTASASSMGTTKSSTIPSGQVFAGRQIGGGTRAQIYGTRQYGSGYPGQTTSSVTGRGFPFGFWPVTFGNLTGSAIENQINSTEYGDPTNSTRPGGALFTAPFQAPNSNSSFIYRLLADNETVTALIPAIISSCSPSSQNITATPFNTSAPKPEQIIQYYRSSSIALSFDEYNNSALFSNNSNTPDTKLPTFWNQTFSDCLNSTIGNQALLLDPPKPSGAVGVQLPGFLMTILVVVHMVRWAV